MNYYQPWQESYDDGHRNGRLDKQLGLRLVTALTSPIPGYGQGYADGQAGRPRYVALEYQKVRKERP